MWIFTRQGFISAVQHKDDEGTIVVRARDIEQLKALFPENSDEIIKMEWADYPYRIHISRARFGAWVAIQAYDLDYPDFKSSIPSDQPIYRAACAEVWETMHSLQHRPITE